MSACTWKTPLWLDGEGDMARSSETTTMPRGALKKLNDTRTIQPDRSIETTTMLKRELKRRTTTTKAEAIQPRGIIQPNRTIETATC